MEDATQDEKEQHDSWLHSAMTERLQRAIAEKKAEWIKQLATASIDGSVDRLRTLGGRIQGLQDAEFLVKGGML